jgi:hypothetical protein
VDSDKLQSRGWIRIIVDVVAVLAVFLVLFGLLAPHDSKQPARIKMAKIEMMNLVAAISQYEAAYGRFPISYEVSSSADFTFGTLETSEESLGITNTSGYQANNSEVMAIIMDLEKFPSGRPTINVAHKFNPRNIVCFAAQMAKDNKSPGLGPDGVLRDPWGHPYIITFDLNGDRKCRDAFYRLASVSESASALGSHAYLVRPSPPPYQSDDARDSFEIPNATVIVWSLGPDGKADKTQKANEGVNKDNITSW